MKPQNDSTTPSTVKVQADLSLGTIYNLIALAEHQNISLVEAVTRAVATEAVIQEKIGQGSRVLLQDRNCGCITELQFKK